MIKTFTVIELVGSNKSMLDEKDIEVLETLIKEGWSIKEIGNWEDTGRERGRIGYSFNLER